MSNFANKLWTSVMPIWQKAGSTFANPLATALGKNQADGTFAGDLNAKLSNPVGEAGPVKRDIFQQHNNYQPPPPPPPSAPNLGAVQKSTQTQDEFLRRRRGVLANMMGSGPSASSSSKVALGG